MQEYTEVKVKIGFCFEREDDVGRKNGNGNLQKKVPLLNFKSRFPPQRRLVHTSFKDADMLYPTKSNSCPK